MTTGQIPREWYGFIRTHIKTHSKEFVLAPHLWGLYAQSLKLRWRKVRFNASNKTEVPTTSRGVYSFIVRPEASEQPGGEYVFYIGRVGKPDNTRNFRDRYREYLQELKTDNPDRIEIALELEQWADQIWFYWAPVKDASMIEDCEDKLIKSLWPPWNKRGKVYPEPPEAAFPANGES